jgi:hypothetical protein
MEIWKDIKDYQGIYQISDKGRVKNVSRKSIRKLQEDKDGYLAVILAKDKKQKRFRVHRLVCEAFSGVSPCGKEQVNHIDEDKKNNSPSNLHWCDAYENQTHSRGILKKFISPKGETFCAESYGSFAAKHGLNKRGLVGLVGGYQNTHKGWRLA